MSENKTKKITKKIEIPKLNLWLIWCLLFVFPSITAIFGFYYLKNDYIYFYENDLINEAFSKIKNYNELITPETFLENQLKDIKKINLNIPIEKIKEQIDDKLCGKTLLCMFFDKELKDAKIIKNQNVFTNFIKNCLINLIKAEKDKNDQSSEATRKQLGNSLQTQFKTITPISIFKDKVSKNFSILYDGELYFIFASFDSPSKDYSYFFAILQGVKISPNKMIKSLSTQFPEIEIVFRKIDMVEISNNPKLIYSGLKKYKDKTYIMAPASLIFTRFLSHGGSTKLDPKYKQIYPFIKYRILTENIENNLKNIEKNIYYLAIIILCFSAFYFLHVSLFGFSNNMKFKTKIILLTLISALFPFTIFTIGIFSIENYNRFMTKIQIQHQAEVEIKNINQGLDLFISELEIKLSEFSSILYNNLENPNYNSEDLSSHLLKIAENIPLSKQVLYLDPVPDNLKILFKENKITNNFSDRNSTELIDAKNEQIFESIPLKVLKNANETIPEERSPQDKINILGNIIDSHDLGDSYRNDGKLIYFDQASTTSWFQIQQISDNSKNKKIKGILLTKFEPRPILDFYLKRSRLSKKHFKETINNYEINYAFLPIEKSGSATIWNGSGNISNEDKNLCLKISQSNQIIFPNKTIIIKKNQKIPHLAVAVITENIPFNEKNFLIKLLSSIILYLLLILYFSSKLIDIMFIEPVMLLATNANAIAKGSEDWNTIIKSGDEFEDLNNNFKNLVTGLKERNILKSYVSEDAFSDIEESSETNLKPGGEYIETTIVFSAIKDYDKISLSITPKESIKLLSKFMSIAEEVTKKYNGSIDKLIGDTIMLVFRHNPTLPSHALRAAKASLELVEKAKDINLPQLYTGIASGRVISGKIGSYSGKLDFTVIGNPVNSAARFKAESKKGTEQTGIIISGTTIGLTKGKAKVKFLRRVAIKGKSRKYNIYELVGIR